MDARTRRRPLAACFAEHGCANETVALRNIGRETESFLWFITQRYDSLAEYTLFTQAAPLAADVSSPARDAARAVRVCDLGVPDCVTQVPDAAMSLPRPAPVHKTADQLSTRHCLAGRHEQAAPGRQERQRSR